MIKTSSDPSSTLNRLRLKKAELLKELQDANARQDPQRGKYLGKYRGAYLALKRHLDGKPPIEKFNVDFSVSILGIPAGVHILNYVSSQPWKQHTFRGAGPGDCDAPEPEEIEYVITDSKGYPADWLARRVDENEFEKFVSDLVAGGCYPHYN